MGPGGNPEDRFSYDAAHIVKLGYTGVNIFVFFFSVLKHKTKDTF